MKYILFLSVILFSSFSQAQLLGEKKSFTKQDTLRGTITPEREWWDLTYYHLDVDVFPEEKTISGKNTITYKVLAPHQVMQIDLQEPMQLTQAIQNGKELPIKHEGNAHFITLIKNQKVGDINTIQVTYNGSPREAVNAPWDGGFSWKKDENGNHFIATSNQGLGASVWWPCKDHMYDEVDSMDMSVTVPKGLTNVSNGRLKSKIEHKNTTTFNWTVKNPINNYGVNINIGDYTNFSEVYKGEKGKLDMDYWVLSYNLDKAKQQFKQAPKMMEAFEHWFGPYPFYEDSFKLVEVPYLGMEHQSSVTYGNKYLNGYLGRDLSGTGWGLKFDFLIIHEAGHEWFANNITNIDIADMWVHEGFTTYSESLFLEYYYGKKAASEYLIGLRQIIKNDIPIIGPYNVNKEGSGDMYCKGANMIHTLRQLVEDDDTWRAILRGLNKDFYHQTVSTQQIEDYLSKKTDIDLTEFFNQYLRTTKIPTLEYTIKNNTLKYRWTNIVDGFDMPIKVTIDHKKQWLYPEDNWKTTAIKGNTILVDDNFYVKKKEI
ncbi:M1 family metallopeptidase [Mangrovimonas spongiae]|uniref:M1 family peptidase n=1 Tax=Mangrovimonas spongiae TaxID=2494697 RepID=A0A3R9NQF0_9FLAO|nr:M1 family metallopeptidase [Mangrovimonas spongiae]RSK39296.1 M1 family peptidase [Mangrovimonas spongiae]